MKITVRYFAAVKESLGRDVEEIDVPADVSTVGALRAHLRGRGGNWAETLAESRRITSALNQDMAKPGAAIRAGDEVAFFPPVTGG